MATTITRAFGFDYGHRILNHESKCANLHGHRGLAEVTVTADKLDSLGRIIDFGKVKELVGGWIDENWDHNMILHENDPLVYMVASQHKKYPPDANEAGVDMREEIYGRKPPYLMPHNPTAENLARVLYEESWKLLGPLNIAVLRVKFWETPNCFAIYIRD
jgi:6-pyruvoyltetrahydropterin/6-carboxytetrahydropterin synthase